MARIDAVYQGLCQHGGDEGITAGDLARQLDISRANCSSDLNRLCGEGRARKIGTKPVYYLPLTAGAEASAPSRKEHFFTEFVQKNPSLSNCVDLAKAAVLYPPNGMNILLLGETGVGKSMFAEMIYDFAASLGRIQRENSFVPFNCADYANNPQLLLSQLFGVVKGAYTGADRDRPGLFEAADGGILFLDEVHRLPAEGQEMLFTYLDRGVFRRLGEATFERRARVMLICATTEEPSSALLQTFLRRLPVTISMPSLTERSLEERQMCAYQFFSQEAARLEQSISVSVNSMRALLGYHCPGNIGQLAGDIRLLCARAFANVLSGEAESIAITSYALPPHIRNGFLNERSRQELWNRLGSPQGRFLAFTPDGALPELTFDESSGDIYEMMERQTESMKRVGMPQEDVREDLTRLLEQYYRRLNEDSPGDVRALEALVGPEVLATTDSLIATAENFTERTLPPNTRFALAMHVFNLLKRVRQGKTIEYPGDSLENNWLDPMAYFAAGNCKITIEMDFNIQLPKDEINFLFHFFYQDPSERQEHPAILVAVIAHGKGTATGMADAANTLLGMEAAIGFDMPMNESPEQVYERLLDYLQARKAVRQVLLLVDMGSLANFARELEQDLSIEARCLSMVSTLHVVEAGRKAAAGASLEELERDVGRVTSLMLDENYIPPPPPPNAQLYVLCACTTGEGSAKMLQELLETQLDLTSCQCQVVALSITDKAAFQRQVKILSSRGRIVAVASAFDTGLSALHIPLSSVLDGSGIPALQKRLNWESLRFRVSESMRGLLDELNLAQAIEAVHSSVSHLEDTLNADLTEEMLVGIFCHMLFMLNRLKKGGSAPVFQNKEALHRKYPGIVAQVERACQQLSKQFEVHVPPDEICYIAAFFTKEELYKSAGRW